MRMAIMSDLHLYRDTKKLNCALRAMEKPDALLIVGDLADRAQKDQYDLLCTCIRDLFAHIPVFCVSGNHDNPSRDDENFREFESGINGQCPYIPDASGAFYCRINDDMDIIGLNPVYHQKLFFFPNKGSQIKFLEEKLAQSSTLFHIVLCHPPLAAHNPQRGEDTTPYIDKCQNDRLQGIIDSHENIIFISGHTHKPPIFELDSSCGNAYINDGSICPTNTGNPDCPVQEGNIAFLDIQRETAHIRFKGIHTGRELLSHQWIAPSSPISETRQ